MDRLISLKVALNLIIDALDSIDILCLITFENRAHKVTELNYMTVMEKARQRAIVEQMKATGGTYFEGLIKELLNIIKKSYESTNGRVQSSIFCTDGDSLDNINGKTQFKTQYKKLKNPNYDFSVHTFLIGGEGNSKDSMKFSDYRDGSFYFIKDLTKLKTVS